MCRQNSLLLTCNIICFSFGDFANEKLFIIVSEEFHNNNKKGGRAAFFIDFNQLYIFNIDQVILFFNLV